MSTNEVITTEFVNKYDELYSYLYNTLKTTYKLPDNTIKELKEKASFSEVVKLLEFLKTRTSTNPLVIKIR
jgi:uncharacterized membrane protein